MTAAVDWTGPRRQPCPACDRGPHDRALSITANPDGSSIAHCFRCGLVETTRGESRPGQVKSRPAVPLKNETLSEHGRELWRACRPVSGPARAYLEARACAIPPADGALRWHAELEHKPSGYRGAALVALVSEAATGRPLTLHRTWIRPDGTKAAVLPPRMLLGGHRKAGGVIRLWPDDAVSVALGVAEGIETALSLAHAAAPCWAAVDAGNLAALPVLPGIETLTIGADNDPAGRQAARRCATRWARAGRAVYVVTAPGALADLNDLAQEVA
jgi:hypothetical protein